MNPEVGRSVTGVVLKLVYSTPVYTHKARTDSSLTNLSLHTHKSENKDDDNKLGVKLTHFLKCFDLDHVFSIPNMFSLIIATNLP